MQSTSLTPQTLIFLALIPFILWRVYSRIRRMVGRQASSPKRQWATICLMPSLVLWLGSLSMSHSDALMLLAGGLVLGVGLGVLGNRLTKFENTPQGLFYTPNAHLGIALSLLLVGRLLYRFVMTGLPGAGAGGPPPNPMASPLTMGIFGILAAYYVTYAIGLVLWRRRVAREGSQPAVTIDSI